MKRLLCIVSLLALLLALAGCTAPTPGLTKAPAVEEPTEAPTDKPLEQPTGEPTQAAEEFSVTVTDGLGREVTLKAKPQRIVSLTLGTDEILLDLVGPERLIGVTYLAADETTSNIAHHPNLPKVANVVEADPEQIIALEPDLVFVASFTDAAVLEQLEGAGITYFAVGFFTSIDAMKENIAVIGQVVGEEAVAAGLVAEMDAALTRVYEAVNSVEVERPTVLYLASDGWVAGAKTTTDDIITLAGGINAAAHLTDWQQVSVEAIIEMNPDVVILSPYVKDEDFLTNPAFAGLKAIQNGRVYTITDAHMSAVSQYVVLGVVDVAKVLYPELFPEG